MTVTFYLASSMTVSERSPLGVWSILEETLTIFLKSLENSFWIWCWKLQRHPLMKKYCGLETPLIFSSWISLSRNDLALVCSSVCGCSASPKSSQMSWIRPSSLRVISITSLSSSGSYLTWKSSSIYWLVYSSSGFSCVDWFM